VNILTLFKKLFFSKSRKAILFVEDTQSIQEELGEFLKKKYIVYPVLTVEEAKKQIEEKQFDYAILDLKLDTPVEFGGVEVWRFLRDKKPMIKIIILSAYSFDQTSEEFKANLNNEEKNFQEQIDSVLREIEGNYISKGGQRVYIEAVLEKLEEFEKG
jgi:CheY-like chemotaxis protein